jgi:phosphate transport system protein
LKRHFETDLQHLEERLLEMGGLVERAIHLSIEALHEEGMDAAMEVIDDIEPRVNDLHREIDELAFNLIALQQPLAVDLRFITAVTRINNDLERMCDRAVNIGRRAISIHGQPESEPLAEIPKMAKLTEVMVHDALDAFRRRDAQLAREILGRDEEVDQYRDTVFQELITEVTNESRFVQQALDLILVCRNFERIADHATNIAENVVFMVLGKDIRHHAK